MVAVDGHDDVGEEEVDGACYYGGEEDELESLLDLSR